MNNPPPEEERIVAYLLDQMTPQEKLSCEQWLTDYPEWQAELAQYRILLGQLPEAFSAEIQPNPRLRRQLLQRGVTRVERSTWLSLGSAAFAAFLLVALGVQNYQLQGERAVLQQQVARAKDELALLRENNVQQVRLLPANHNLSASGLLLTLGDRTQALLNVHGLPPIAGGQIYKLWAVIDGKRIACGQFKPARNGQVIVLVPFEPGMEHMPLIITAEPAASSTSSGKVLLLSS